MIWQYASGEPMKINFHLKTNKGNPGLFMFQVSLLRIEDAGDHKIVITSRSVLFMECQQTYCFCYKISFFLSDAIWKGIYSPFEKVILRYFKIIILLDAILFENSSQNKVNK